MKKEERKLPKQSGASRKNHSRKASAFFNYLPHKHTIELEEALLTHTRKNSTAVLPKPRKGTPVHSGQFSGAKPSKIPKGGTHAPRNLSVYGSKSVTSMEK